MSQPSLGIEAQEKLDELIALVASMDRTINVQDAAAQKAQKEILQLTLANRKLRAKLKERKS